MTSEDELAILLEKWLIEMGFRKHQIGMKFGKHTKDLVSITVYLAPGRLHFLVSGFEMDCALLSGGMADPIGESYIRLLVPRTDLRDPQSLEIFTEAIFQFKPKYKV